MSAPPRPPGAGGSADAAGVTPNQRAILLQLFAGAPLEQIAARTGRKPSTIANTVRLVRRQLGARSGYDLFRECVRLRIVRLPEIYALADAQRSARTAPRPRRRG